MHGEGHIEVHYSVHNSNSELLQGSFWLPHCVPIRNNSRNYKMSFFAVIT